MSPNENKRNLSINLYIIQIKLLEPCSHHNCYLYVDIKTTVIKNVSGQSSIIITKKHATQTTLKCSNVYLFFRRFY